MKDYHYELSDLEANDRVGALVLLLINKYMITQDEFTEALEAILEIKNDALAKELEANPGMKLFFDLGGLNKKGEKDE